MNAQERYAFSILFLAVLTSLLGIGILVPFLPKILYDLGSRGLVIGAIIGGFSLTRALGMPFAGNWGDRYGRRLFLIIGTAGYLISAIGYVLVKDSVMGIGVVRILNGLVASISMPVAMAYAGDLAKKAREGFTMGVFNVAVFTGFGSGPILGGFIYEYYGYEMVFYAMAAISALALVLLFFLPESKGRPKPVPVLSMYRNVVKSRMVLALFSHRVVLSAGRATAMAFLPILAINEWDISEKYVGIVLSAPILLPNLLQPVFGWVADRANRIIMVVFGSLGATMCYFLIPHTGTFSLLLLVCASMGLFGAVSIPAATAIAVTEGRDYGMGEVMAFFNMGMPIGHAIGFMLTGWIMDAFGIISLFYFSGFVGIFGVALFIFLVYGSRGEGPSLRGPPGPIEGIDMG